MKRLFFLIYIFIMILFNLVLPVFADTDPVKVLSLNYDNASSIICITTRDNNIQDTRDSSPQKFVRLSTPNRIYFDINNAVLVGEKQQLAFSNSPIKEIKLAQFSVNPNIVRTVITFEEDFDTSKIKLLSVGENIITRISPMKLLNEYYNTIYEDTVTKTNYSKITAESQYVQKVVIPISTPPNSTNKEINEIQKAFEKTTLTNSDGKSYDSVISVDLSSNLKLRTKYFINQYIPKNNGILVSGFGQITTSKIFYLTSPNRIVIDMPNTFLDKSIRNKEISICPTGVCKDTAKIGQFDENTARLVITTDNTKKYMPIYSKDSQSLFIANIDKLDHTTLEQSVSNLSRTFVRKLNSNTNEIVMSFTMPVVHSVLRTDNSLNLYMFNVKSYNNSEYTNAINNSLFKGLSMSLLPQTGIKASMSLSKDDKIKIDESIDGKSIKITLTKAKVEEVKTTPVVTQDNKTPAKPHKIIKNKIVLDAGHGGSDYGAIREGINEKDINLDVTHKVAAILRSKGYKVELTRTNDVFVSLEDRVDFSENECPEIFVSIHVNSAVTTEANGIETHWYHDYSKNLATIVQNHFKKELPDSKDRGLFKSKFYVINHTTVPAILCEIGFISNENERNELITEARKQKTAKAIAEGIIEYLKSDIKINDYNNAKDDSQK